MATQVVGREAESRTVAGFLDSVTAGPAALVVEGEADIGKTTVWLAALERAAELTASGVTTRDMAAALFVSPKTVEVQLTRIYQTLNIHTRAELGRIMEKPTNRESPDSTTRPTP
jgi:DNA-binding CsgD family transcriptional regulator